MQRFVRNLILLTVSMLAGGLLMAQADYNIHLKAGTIDSKELPQLTSLNSPQFQEALFEGNYYLLLQFEALPSAEQKESMTLAGIRLLDYIPNFSFLAQIDRNVSVNQLKGFGVRAAMAMAGSQKMAVALAQANFPPHAVVDADHISVSILPYKSIDRTTLMAHLTAHGIESMPSPELHNGLIATIAINKLYDVAELAPVMYMQPGEPEPVPDGIRGRTSHRANTLSPRPGVGFDGSGVVLADADDGSIEHIDFQGRLTDLTDGNLGGDHGDMTLGIAGGAANLDPRVPGMATGADLIIYDIGGYPQIVDAISNYQNLGTVITTTSYSQGCGGLYDATAEELDADVYQEPQILHVFSAGNSATSTCSNVYGSLQAPDGRYYGNITGGRKAAKNSIATANMRFDDSRDATSSRGPCEDGRLKPDISAHGNGQLSTGELNTIQVGGGTSAAAPGIAGVSAMLYQAYKESHNGNNPEGAFMKALILNTADDLGRPGPDYDFGWGRINAKRAYEAMDNNQFMDGVIKHDSTHIHTINVPAGVQKMKVMVLWLDPAGNPNAAKALVNDLDIELVTPNQMTYKPWILSTVANIDSLQADARRGVDRLNNMEQVTLDNPAAGTYSLNVKGFAVPSNEQKYHVIYSFITDELELTYPYEGEFFTPGTNEVIRWDAYGNTGPFSLAYSTDNGQNWNNIITVAPDLRYFAWNVPSTISKEVIVRVTRGSQESMSTPFHIMNRPDENLIQFQITGLSTAELTWAAVTGADVYDIYTLGNKYMDSLASTTATSYTLTNLAAGQDYWFAVRARTNNGVIGQRSVARRLAFKPASVCEGCLEQVTTFPSFQGFEDGFGNWCNFDNDFFDWRNSSGPTASQNTGPAGADEGLNYVYTEASGANNPNRIAILGSPCLNPTGFTDFKMYFAYHMFGSEMGSLGIQVTTNNGQSWSNTIWSKSGNQGANWIQDSVDLTNYLGNVFAIRFIGTTGSGFRSDMALDRILFSGTDTCVNLRVNSQVTDVACVGQNNGAIALSTTGNLGALSYNWSNGATTASLSSLSAGYYSVAISDTTGCTRRVGYLVNDGVAISAQVLTNDVACFGDTTGGSALVNLSGGNGGYAISWSNGSTSPSLGNLAPGIYTFNVVDSLGCAFHGQARINEPARIAPNATVNNIACFGFASGSINLNPLGGTSPYYFVWDSGPFSSQITNLAAGTYGVTIRDSRNCSVKDSFRIIEPPQLDVDFAITNESVAGAMDGAITATGLGGTPPYRSYQWTTGASQQTITGLSAGMYIITLADDNLCRLRDTAIVGIEPGVSIGELLALSHIQLFPNPAQDEIFLSFTSEEALGWVELNLIDMLGKQLQSRQVQVNQGENRFELNTQALTQGTYLIEMRSEEGRMTKKFVKVE